MSHDIFKPSNLIGCFENKTADSAQTRKRAIVTRPFPSPGGRGLGTRLPHHTRGVRLPRNPGLPCLRVRGIISMGVDSAEIPVFSSLVPRPRPPGEGKGLVTIARFLVCAE